MYYTYVLQSLSDHKFYIGFTQDLKQRLITYKIFRTIWGGGLDMVKYRLRDQTLNYVMEGNSVQGFHSLPQNRINSWSLERRMTEKNQDVVHRFIQSISIYWRYQRVPVF